MTESANTTRNRAATIVWVAALILWICFIWGHSLLPGDDSLAESNVVVGFLAPLFDALGLADASLRITVVRKAAHFMEHAVLAVLATGAIGRLFDGMHAWPLVACAICVAVPCIDETIQLFVPGRSGELKDVCIDLCGCALGALIAWLIRLAKRTAKG